MATDSNPHSTFLWLWFRHTSPGGWTQYRRLSSNKEAWFQRVIESWWILIGEWSLSEAYNAGAARQRIAIATSTADAQKIIEEFREKFQKSS